MVTLLFTSNTLGVVAQSHEPGTHVTSVKHVITKLINNPNESLRINHDHPQQKTSWTPSAIQDFRIFFQLSQR